MFSWFFGNCIDLQMHQHGNNKACYVYWYQEPLLLSIFYLVDRNNLISRDMGSYLLPQYSLQTRLTGYFVSGHIYQEVEVHHHRQILYQIFQAAVKELTLIKSTYFYSLLLPYVIFNLIIAHLARVNKCNKFVTGELNAENTVTSNLIAFFLKALKEIKITQSFIKNI